MHYGPPSSLGRSHKKMLNLPAGFCPIQDILEENGPDVGKMTNVVGMVRDVRLPAPTKGAGQY